MNDRTERIRADLDAAETAKTEAVGVLDGYKAQLADAKARGRPDHRGGPPVGRRAEEGPGGPAPDGAGRGPGPRRRRHRGRQGPGHRRPAGRARPAGRRCRLRRRQQEPRPGRPDAAHRGLHQLGRDATDDRRAVARLRGGSARGRPLRGRAGRGRATSCSASPACSRPTTSCAPRSPTSSCR